MSEEQQFCLRWNNFQANFTSQFEALRTAEEFVDVTLACDGQRLQAHRVVLSACSPYFKELFRSNPCKHPILFLRDVEFCHLQSLVEFMYAGEVNVAQAQLSTFLQTAEALQIRGLTESPQRHKQVQGHKRKHFSPSENYSSPEEDNIEDDDDDEVLCISSPTNSPPAKIKRNMNEYHDESNTQQSSHSHISMEQAVQLSVAAQKSIMLHNQEIEEGSETFQPKIEVPDYNSDEECKTDNSGVSSSFIGLDNSLDLNNSLTSIQGGAEMLSGSSSQNFLDVSQDLTQGSNYNRRVMCKTGGFQRRRGHSWSRYVSHVPQRGPLSVDHRSIHSRDSLIPVWIEAEACEKKLRAINQWNFKKLTRGLASLLFSQAELATRSVTGQRWARADLEGRPTKPALDGIKVRAIISHVITKFPGVTPSMIKQVLAYKCKESARSISSI